MLNIPFGPVVNQERSREETHIDLLGEQEAKRAPRTQQSRTAHIGQPLEQAPDVISHLRVLQVLMEVVVAVEKATVKARRANMKKI